MREPFQYIEIDLEVCSNVYGNAPCAAILGVPGVGTGQRKCFNMWRHCQDQENFATTTKTLRFCENLSSVPVGLAAYPVLNRVSARYSTVNIGGMDRNLSPFGRRATLEVNLADFIDEDLEMDPYQAERISGAAQVDEGPYVPKTRGTFFTKLRARWPYYPGRAMRHVSGYIENGAVISTQTRHFVMSEWQVGTDGSQTVIAKDILHLADNDRAVAPANSQGELGADISISATSISLQPTGIGDSEYPDEGFVSIGSELMSFTRAGDTLTVVRAASGTEAANHSAGDRVQLSFSPRNQRIDDVVYDLLVNYAGISAGYIDQAVWKREIDRWASSLLVDTDVIRPERVSDLIAELAVIGISLWWDDVTQQIGLKMMRPPDGDTVHLLTDDANIKEVSISDQDKNRITEISFSYDQISADKSATDAKSYSREQYIVAADAKLPNAFADTLQKQITFRWLNQGDDTTARIAALRIIKRQSFAPRQMKMVLDAKDREIGLTDVLRVKTSVNTDEVGASVTSLWQVIGLRPVVPGHSIEVTAQTYEYDGRAGYIAPDTYPTYDLATDEQREAAAFIASDGNLLPDGTEAYEII